MRRIISFSFAVLIMPAAALLSPQANAQQWPPNPHQYTRAAFEEAARAKQLAARQVSPSVIDFSDGRRAAPPPEVKIVVDPQLDARSKRIFPAAAYDADQEALRMRWIVDQEQRALANEINRTKPLVYPVSGR